MTHVVVREFARLTTEVGRASLDEHTVSMSAFEHVCELAAGFKRAGFAQLMTLEGHRSLRLDQFVGVVQTQCGTTLEILPKSASNADDANESRRLLRKMLLVARGARSREAGVASIETLQQPLTEWVMAEFVRELRALIRRGVRSEYREVEAHGRFLRGRLRVGAQLREAISRQHLFHVAYDELSPDRPENRLLRAALDRVLASTRISDTWRVARELAITLAGIPASQNYTADFGRWSSGRLMAHYGVVRPWCELVLGVEMPLALLGATWGSSFLFPMDKLFERYVEVVLRKQVGRDYVLKPQSRRHSLLLHQPTTLPKQRTYFTLMPDFAVEAEPDTRTVCVMDAKWKRVNETLTKPGRFESIYSLSQDDLYQMHAYGHSYLQGAGDMFLICPRWESFNAALPPFHFTEHLRLWVIPFDLDADRLLLPESLKDVSWLRASGA